VAAIQYRERQRKENPNTNPNPNPNDNTKGNGKNKATATARATPTTRTRTSREMDMTHFLHRSLTNTELMQRVDRRYEGRIVQVCADKVFNKFKLTKEEVVPVIQFDDGWDWIPNRGARRALVAAWGAETDGWIGRRLRVQLVTVARTEKISGRLVERFEKEVEPLADAEASR
jgi:hypothetical protein